MPMSREERPQNEDYYEVRLPLLSQGDIFRDVPLAYPMPAEEIVEEQADTYGGSRRYLSGPLDFGLGLLLTPTCSMRQQGNGGGDYAHPVRTLAPIWPIEGLGEMVNESSAGLLRKYDSLISLMYIPPNADLGIPESAALLYMPVTLHHNIIDGQRLTQLAIEGARQLQRKLVHFASGVSATRSFYDPPMD